MRVTGSIRRLIVRAAIALPLVAAAGCEHKGLVEREPEAAARVVVDFGWAPAEAMRPEGMACLFFPSAGASGHYWRADCAPGGGVAYVPPGEYDVVAFNNDTRDVLFSSLEDFATVALWATPLIPDGALPVDGLPLCCQPDMVWTATAERFMVTGTAADTLRLAPRRATRTYHVEVDEIEHRESTVNYYFAITHLAQGYMPATGAAAGSDVAMGAALEPAGSDNLTGTLLNFGPGCHHIGPRLNVYMWLADGTRRVYSYVVAEQISSAPDSMDVWIKVKGPALPEVTPGGGTGTGGGFDVGVDDWEHVDIEL